MLMKSDINPFESQEVKPYRNDPRISAMTDLVEAYQRDDLERYESILQNNKDLLADPFISENIDEVTRNVRTKSILKLVAPYTRFTMSFIAQRLRISEAEVEDIIGFLIVDGKLKGRIDQSRGTVEIERKPDVTRMHALQQWTSAIKSLWTTVLSESDGFKVEEMPTLGGFAAQPSFSDMSHMSFDRRPGNAGRFRGAPKTGQVRMSSK